MFTKKPEKDPVTLAPAPQAAPMAQINTMRPVAQTPTMANTGRNSPSIIGADLIINGNLVSKGEVQVEGEIQGDLHGAHIVVGENAKITGGLVAEEVIVRGHVMGSIRGNRVTLQSSSRVEGDVFHQTLAIEQGAFFEGKSRRSDNPTSVAAPTPKATPTLVPTG
jgi:cytoskeletal protein CcmA (bactofilin family)